jgi:uncharacterized repeat protein (TIGR03803 family)
MGPPDGYYPEASLTPDPAGNVYGTTYAGGSLDSGTVFKFDTNGIESLLYNLTGVADGANPVASLIRDPKGNLYGTTVNGGSFGQGVVFKLIF